MARIGRGALKGNLRAAEDVPPHAGRMTQALTGLGYSFERAMADIVDNSITAGATKVWVDIRSKASRGVERGPYVLVVDNGGGMNQRRLVAAMQYGAESSISEHGLGKFGLGLKTASTSQANVVTVASRVNTNGSFAVRAWDLDYLKDRGRWTLLAGHIDQFPPIVMRRLRRSSGTAVLWTRLTRALPEMDRLDSADLNRVMNEYAHDTLEHLSIVFNRFLTGNTRERRRKVAMWVNDVRVDPRDPLLRTHPDTKLQRRRTFVIKKDDGSDATFFLQPAILPIRDQFVDDEGAFDRAAHKRAGGARGWNAAQGLYIYREDRLIQDGGWSRLRAADEHSKTARIDVDLTRSSDELFKLNVAKTRILLPKVVKEEIQEYTAKVVSVAKKAYGKSEGSPKKKLGKKKATMKLPDHSPKMVLTSLERACRTTAERATLLRIIKRHYPGYITVKGK